MDQGQRKANAKEMAQMTSSFHYLPLFVSRSDNCCIVLPIIILLGILSILVSNFFKNQKNNFNEIGCDMRFTVFVLLGCIFNLKIPAIYEIYNRQF